MRGSKEGASLFAWVVRKALGTVLVLLGASFLLFAVVRASPGDASSSAFLPASGAGASEEIRGQLGLAAPWPTQYLNWLLRTLGGDFGRSAALRRGHPVADLLWPAVRRSLTLAGASLALSATFALALAGLRRARPFSRILALGGGAAAILSAVPVFLLVYGAVAGGNGFLAWGSSHGLWDLPSWFPLPSRDAWVPWALAASILALGDGLFLDLHQRFRAELDRAVTTEYLAGARMLGLSVPLLIARGFAPGAASHVARRFSFLLGSLAVAEATLGWPGLGHLAWRAASERDTPVLLGVALVSALAVRIGVLAADAVQHFADPRSRA